MGDFFFLLPLPVSMAVIWCHQVSCSVVFLSADDLIMLEAKKHHKYVRECKSGPGGWMGQSESERFDSHMKHVYAIIMKP